MSLELVAAERELLTELLRDELGRLKSEIYHTEDRDFQELLKGRKAILVALIARLETADSAA